MDFAQLLLYKNCVWILQWAETTELRLHQLQTERPASRRFLLHQLLHPKFGRDFPLHPGNSHLNQRCRSQELQVSVRNDGSYVLWRLHCQPNPRHSEVQRCVATSHFFPQPNLYCLFCLCGIMDDCCDGAGVGQKETGEKLYWPTWLHLVDGSLVANCMFVFMVFQIIGFLNGFVIRFKIVYAKPDQKWMSPLLSRMCRGKSKIVGEIHRMIWFCLNNNNNHQNNSTTATYWFLWASWLTRFLDK